MNFIGCGSTSCRKKKNILSPFKIQAQLCGKNRKRPSGKKNPEGYKRNNHEYDLISCTCAFFSSCFPVGDCYHDFVIQECQCWKFFDRKLHTRWIQTGWCWAFHCFVSDVGTDNLGISGFHQWHNNVHQLSEFTLHDCPCLWVSCIDIFCVWGMARLLVLVYLWLLQCDTCFNWIHLHLAGSLFSSGFLAKWFRMSCIILNQQIKTTYKKNNDVLYCITSIIFFFQASFRPPNWFFLLH